MGGGGVVTSAGRRKHAHGTRGNRSGEGRGRAGGSLCAFRVSGVAMFWAWLEGERGVQGRF
jgi:hypothetical protein